METYRFCEGGWDRLAFLPAWSTACKVRKEFLQEVDCIKNFSEEGEFCYTSMVTGNGTPLERNSGRNVPLRASGRR